ncbi:MAG: pyridoxal phosphate-dependent aminotransferase [Ignisphaera sp.]
MKAIEKIKPSILNLKERKSFAYLAIAKKLALQGYEVVNFGIGQPDVGTPNPIVEEAKKALDEGFTKYTESSGLTELREAIAEYLNTRFSSNVKPSEVLVTPGALPAIFLAYLGYVEPGDEVVIVEPSYPPYTELTILFKAKPVYIPLNWMGPNKGFELDMVKLEESVNERTKMIVINNPHNPTGAIIPPKHIEKILEIAEKVNAIILVDEVYNEIIYDGADFKSVIGFENWKDNTIYVNSLSKTFSMTGWRLGYLVAREDVVIKLANLAVNIWSCPTSFVQKAGIAAFKNEVVWEYVKDMVKLFKRRRDFMVSKLRGINDLEVWPSQGTFYLFPYLGKILDNLGMNDELFAELLLYNKYVVVLPGSGFPDKAGKNFIRLSFAVDEDVISKGIDRIKQFFEEIKIRKER